MREVREKIHHHGEPEKEAESIAAYKLDHYRDLVVDNIVLCADTIVAFDGNILGKPDNEQKAFSMLRQLSNKSHHVITGVAIGSPEGDKIFSTSTKVTFGSFSEFEIDYYIKNFKPLDKAGAYGIQEWIGLIGIPHIEGSYYNVMGLPVADIYRNLKFFFT